MKIIYLILLSVIDTARGHLVRQSVVWIRPSQLPDGAIDRTSRRIIISSRPLKTDSRSSENTRANDISLFSDQGVHRLNAPRLFRPLPHSTTNTLSMMPPDHEDQLNAHPHQASLRVKRGPRAFRHKCGGSLIAAKWVLTAAHCVNNVTTSSMRIVMGDYDLTVQDPYEKTYPVIESLVHPLFNLTPGTFSNDVALLKLDRSAITPGITPIALYGGQATFAGQSCIITGWGSTERTRDSMVLRQANIPVITNSQCSTMWRRTRDAMIVPSHICGFARNISVCNGDSGGPMVCDGLLAGVASWTIRGCGAKHPNGAFPSVYVRVSHYIDWIMNTIRANNVS